MSSSGRPLGLPGRLPEPDESHRLESQPPPAGVWIDWGPALPESYAQDRVKLLVRDPWCLFAYWELTGPHADWVPRDNGADIFTRSKWLVRLFADGALELEIPAAHPLGAHYFAVEPERRYRAEVGLLTSAGAWIRVASDGDSLPDFLCGRPQFGRSFGHYPCRLVNTDRSRHELGLRGGGGAGERRLSASRFDRERIGCHCAVRQSRRHAGGEPPKQCHGGMCSRNCRSSPSRASDVGVTARARRRRSVRCRLVSGGL